LGKKVAIIEKEYWGGVCLNVGCIPTKSLLRNAELAHIVTKEAKTSASPGTSPVDYGVAFSAQPQGVGAAWWVASTT
jgi:dihydrolipoamide dehydrogenase